MAFGDGPLLWLSRRQLCALLLGSGGGMGAPWPLSVALRV